MSRLPAHVTPLALSLLISAAFVVVLAGVIAFSAVDELRAGIAMRQALAWYGSGELRVAQDQAKRATEVKKRYAAPLWLLARIDAMEAVESGVADLHASARDRYERLGGPSGTLAVAALDLLRASPRNDAAIQQAEAVFRKSLGEPAGSGDAEANLAVCAFLRGDLEDAMTRARRVVEGPGDIRSAPSLDSLYAAGAVLAATRERQGDLAGAQQAYEGLIWLENEPDPSEPLRRLGVLRHVDARTHRSRLLIRRIDAIAYPGDLQQALADASQGFGAFDQVLQDRKGLPPRFLGEIQYKHALQFAHVDSHRYLMDIDRRLQEALRLLDEGGGDTTVPRWRAGQFLFMMGLARGNRDLQERGTAWIAAAPAGAPFARLPPAARAVHVNDEGCILLAQGNEEASREKFEEALAGGGAHGAARFNLAVLDARGGRHQEALDGFERARADGAYPISGLEALLKHLRERIRG